MSARGVVTSFSLEKGFGFITPHSDCGLDGDHYFHIKSLGRRFTRGSLAVGTVVAFTPAEGNGRRPSASGVQVVQQQQKGGSHFKESLTETRASAPELQKGGSGSQDGQTATRASAQQLQEGGSGNKEGVTATRASAQQLQKEGSCSSEGLTATKASSPQQQQGGSGSHGGLTATRASAQQQQKGVACSNDGLTATRVSAQQQQKGGSRSNDDLTAARLLAQQHKGGSGSNEGLNTGPRSRTPPRVWSSAEIKKVLVEMEGGEWEAINNQFRPGDVMYGNFPDFNEHGTQCYREIVKESTIRHILRKLAR